jgi:hypothetical protein
MRQPPHTRQPVGVHLISSGTSLWRVWKQSLKAPARTAITFNPTPSPTVLGGGRFDSLTAPNQNGYAYWYAAEDEETALVEQFLRNMPKEMQSPRHILRQKVAGAQIAEIRVLRDLALADLTGASLNAMGAGAWLTACEESDYLTCREWAKAIREWAPDVDGLWWRSTRNNNSHAIMLFDPPATETDLEVHSNLPLDTPLDIQRLNTVLAPHGAVIEP